jgi:tetratricopeptide (TPR) repeat protein
MSDLRARLQSALGDAYRIEQELGGGGMSRVFLAQEVRLGRPVVVKVLPPEMAAGVSAERFEREIQLAAKLQHPHIVPLLTAGSQDDLLYYVMPHIAGESLRARLAHDHELPVGETVRIMRDVCDALAYAHAHGIVHRDVKPDNVLFSGKHALVTDFGVAKAVAQSTGSTSLTSLGVALGTPAYMAPEQAAADPATDHRADIYAVGVVAYEMLAGRPPFVGPSPQSVLAAQVSTPPEPVTKYRESTPPALAALIMRCLAKRPADRFQSAGEMVDQLEQMVTPTTGSAPYDAVAAAVARRAHPVRVAGLFAVSAVAVLGVAYFLMNQLGLPAWVLPGAVLLLAVGLPVMLVTGFAERRRALASVSGRGQPPTGLHHWLTWRKALTGGVLAFAGLGLAAGSYMAMRVLGIGPVGTLVASGVLAQRDRLVLADFENRSADSTLGPSLTEALRVDLAQSPVVRLLDPAAVGQALGRMGRAPATPLHLAVARELAQREGAKAVVHGQVDPLGRGYVVSAELVSAADGTVLVAVRENAKDDGAIIEAVDRLSHRLRERIGESLRTIRASEPLEQVTTGSLDALRRYSQAVQVWESGRAEEAVALLEEATALDTAFAMAYRKLAVVLGNSGGAPSRITAAATAAFRHRDRLPPLERDLTTAHYYWTVDYDPKRVAAAYGAVLELDPENGIALNNLALVFIRKRRWAEAESLIVRGLALSGGANLGSLYINAVEVQVAQGKFAAAARSIDLLAGHLSPTNPMVTWLRAGFAAARREFDSSEVYAHRLALDHRDVAFQEGAALGLYGVHAIRGRLAAAETDLRQARTAAEQRGLPGSYLSYAAVEGFTRLRYRDDRPGALAAVEAALKRHPLASMPASDRPYPILAALYAAVGQAARARGLLAEYEREIPEPVRRGQPYRHGAEAVIAVFEGRVPDAITGFRAWYDEESCAACGLYELGKAYDRAGQSDSALAVYERAVAANGMSLLADQATELPLIYKRIGELYDQKRDAARARDYYGRFVDLWKDADPELQPLVRDVRARIARLTAEPTN